MRVRGAERNIPLLYTYWGLREFQIWIPIWVVFLTVERGFSLTQVTTAEGLFLIGIIVLEVPTGAIADRYGRALSMSLGAVTLAFAILIYAFTHSFEVLLASFLLWSLAHALMSGADRALAYDTLKELGRERDFEKLMGRGIALTWAGAAVATAIGAPVAALTSMRTAIFTGVAVCLAAAVVALFLHEPPRFRANSTRDSYVGTITGAFREAFGRADVRYVVLLSAAGMAVLTGASYLMQPYLLDRGLEIGVLFSLLQVPPLLAGIAGAWFAGRFVRGSPAPMIAVCVLAGCLAYVVLALAPGLTGYLMLPLLFVLVSLLEPVSAGYVNRRIESERRATVLSIQGMAHSLILAGIAPGLGALTDSQGLSWAFSAGALAALATVLLFGTGALAALRSGYLNRPISQPPTPS